MVIRGVISGSLLIEFEFGIFKFSIIIIYRKLQIIMLINTNIYRIENLEFFSFNNEINVIKNKN